MGRYYRIADDDLSLNGRGLVSRAADVGHDGNFPARCVGRRSDILHAMFHVVLFRPEIPPNTGNLIRLCANTGATLHLVKPLGFELEGRAVRRAGLDYRNLAELHVHADLAHCLAALVGARLFSVETGGSRSYSDAQFAPGDALLFGSESRGLPAEALAALPVERQLAIPMMERNRSLNLANAVAIVVYEAWRQNGFAGAVSST
jgi:tRNA (cytidine/uridine-2'-O-)-methyltransferase